MKKAARRVGVAAALLAGAVLLMFSIQRLFVFPRYMIKPPDNPSAGIEGLERLSISTADGPVDVWFLAGRGVTPDAPGPAVLFGHGNGELIDEWAANLEPYRRMGVSLILPEYRGYGRSAGSPSQEAITADLVAAHDMLRARPEVDAGRIVYHGRSLGGGAVCALATQRQPAALILQSTFTSIRDMARRYFFPGFLVRDPFDNVGTIQHLNLPILILHGTRDEVVPFGHAERLQAAAPRATLIAYGADHNDWPPGGEAYWRDIAQFLREAGILPAGNER
jgi:hypothetical protein